MSGGRFDYIQRNYSLDDAKESIQKEIENSGKLKSKKDLYEWHDDEWYEKYPEDRYYTKYSNETIKEFKKAIKYTNLMQIYLQRVDWFLSGDDGEESFHKRLKEDLK